MLPNFEDIGLNLILSVEILEVTWQGFYHVEF